MAADAEDEGERFSQAQEDVSAARMAARLQAAIDCVSDAFYALDSDWRVVAFNKAAETYFGFAAQHVLGRSLWEIFPQGRGTAFGEALECAMEARQSSELTTLSALVPGRIIAVSVAPWDDGVCVAIDDLTDRDLAQRRLQESEERLRFAAALAAKQRAMRDPAEIMAITCESVARFMGVSRAGFYRILDEDRLAFDVSWTDGALASITGEVISITELGADYNEHARAGRPIVSSDTHSADDIGREAGRFGARAGVAAPILRQGRWQGGFYLSSARPRAWSNEEIGFVRELAQTSWDNIERAEAEAEVRLSEARFRSVAETAPVMLWMGDARGKCLYLNRAQREFWGVAPEDVAAFDWSTTVHPEDAAALYEPFTRAMAERAGFRVEARYRRADGVWRLLRSEAQPRFDARGDFAGMIGVNVDVTDARAAENALHALNATLEQRIEAALEEQSRSAKALEQTREALFQAQKMEAVGQLTGGIAHDFNNMLAGIIGAMKLIERRITDKRFDEAGKYVSAALDSAHRAASLTSRLLAFGRRQSLDIRPVDVNVAVGAIEPLLRQTLDENIELAFELSERLPFALTDAHQLESALLNLALNARDAMPDGGAIKVATRLVRGPREAGPEIGGAGDDYIEVSVSDTGVGMAPDVLARAFEPFFTTKPSGAGTGLGLSMVYGFAKQTGGDIAIESEVGKGAQVRLFLPQSQAQAEPERAPISIEAPSGHGEVVLVVEDDPLVRMLVLDVLKDLGYTAEEAKDAQVAIGRLESGTRIDLMISDVGLPGLNGRQLADIARYHRPALKVLFLTGYAEHAAVRSIFLDAGMELMTKPFAIEALATKIKTMLRG